MRKAKNVLPILIKHRTGPLILQSRPVLSIVNRGSIRTMAIKRKAPGTNEPPAKARKEKEPLPDYCDVEPRRAENGSILWPAAPEAMEKSRDFLKEWWVMLINLYNQF